MKSTRPLKQNRGFYPRGEVELIHFGKSMLEIKAGRSSGGTCTTFLFLSLHHPVAFPCPRVGLRLLGVYAHSDFIRIETLVSFLVDCTSYIVILLASLDIHVRKS